MAKAQKKIWRKFDLFHQISCARWCVVFGCGACAFLLFSGTFIFAQIMYRMPYTHRNMIDFMLVTRGYELKCFMCYSWWCSHTQRIYLISSHFYYSICIFESFLFYVLLWSNGKRKHVLSLKLFLLTWLCHFKASQVKWLMKVPTVVINYRLFFWAYARSFGESLEIESQSTLYMYTMLYYISFVLLKNWKIFQYKVIVFERKILMLWQIGKKKQTLLSFDVIYKVFRTCKNVRDIAKRSHDLIINVSCI